VSHGDRSGKLKRMCGRYQRRSDKQRIAEVFQVRVGLEDLYLDAEDDIAPGSVQPVVLSSADGERRIERMRWGFKLPDRLLFNARSEGIDVAKFWSDRFKTGRCIVPADTFFEWAKAAEGRNMSSPFRAASPSAWLVFGLYGRTPGPMPGKTRLPYLPEMLTALCSQSITGNRSFWNPENTPNTSPQPTGHRFTFSEYCLTRI
jgi:hypothetical protein